LIEQARPGDHDRQSGGARLRVAAVGPETVALEVIQAAPGDETEIGTRIQTTLRDYLEAWGEGTFSAPNEDAETSSSAAPPGA
jgi:hypothetical protein